MRQPRTSRERRRSLGTLALAISGVACAPRSEPATAIVVSVKTDLVIGDELRELSYRVFRADDDPELDAPVAQFTAAAQTLSHPFVIVQQSASELLLSVEGFASVGDDPVVVQRVRARFVRGKSLALHVFLARACLYAFCEIDGLSCYGEPYGQVLAGQCAAIAGPLVLDEIARAGQEQDWEPIAATSMDGGLLSPWEAGL